MEMVWPGDTDVSLTVHPATGGGYTCASAGPGATAVAATNPSAVAKAITMRLTMACSRRCGAGSSAPTQVCNETTLSARKVDDEW